MREEAEGVREALERERGRVGMLVGFVREMWEVLGKVIPREEMPEFPEELLEEFSAEGEEGGDSPNIMITTPPAGDSGGAGSAPPTARRVPPLHTTNLGLSTHASVQSLRSLSSASSSPTLSDFPGPGPGMGVGGRLSRQPSFAQAHPHNHTNSPVPSLTGLNMGGGEAGESPIDGPGSGSRKRARHSESTSDDNVSVNISMSSSSATATNAPAPPKRVSRARSDSAPLGYPQAGWGGSGRPRSGSSIAGVGGAGQIVRPRLGMTMGAGSPGSPMDGTK